MDGYADSIEYDERDAERRMMLAEYAERGSVTAESIVGRSGCEGWERNAMERGEW